MKKIALIAMSAAAAIATPAMAQVEGTINITGRVDPKCYVLTSDTASSTTFGGTVPLGELAKTDGTLKSSADLEGAFNAAASSINARVLCTHGSANISVDANPLKNEAPAVSGYDNEIDYTANVELLLAGVGSQTVPNSTTSGATVNVPVSAPFRAGTDNNLKVRTSGWTADGVLVAGTYNGVITVKIAPVATPAA